MLLRSGILTVSILSALLLGACTLQMGERRAEVLVPPGDFKYRTAGALPSGSLESLSLSIRVKKSLPDLPVSLPLDNIRHAVEAEIRHAGGEVGASSAGSKAGYSDLEFLLTVSKYNVESHRGDVFVNLDCSVRAVSGAERELLVEKNISIKGRGDSVSEAHQNCLATLTFKMFSDSEIGDAIRKHLNGFVSDDVSAACDKLAARLYRSFVGRIRKEDARKYSRLAFGPFSSKTVPPDTCAEIAERLFTSCGKGWPPEQFHFFSRTQLDTILKEQNFQMSDIFDRETAVPVGRLKGVQCLVTGNVFSQDDCYMVEVRIFYLETGRLICAERQKIPR